MAEINLLPRKIFEITLESGEVVKGQYSFWVISRLCDRKGWSLSQLEERMSDKNLAPSDVVNLLLCAVEYASRKEKKPFTYSDLDAADWIEELGGIMGEKFLKVWEHSKSEVEIEGDGEKKN